MMNFKTNDDVSEMLNVSKSTLYRLRRNGNGPPFMKLGKAIIYKETDIVDWTAQNTGYTSIHERKKLL